MATERLPFSQLYLQGGVPLLINFSKSRANLVHKFLFTFGRVNVPPIHNHFHTWRGQFPSPSFILFYFILGGGNNSISPYYLNFNLRGGACSGSSPSQINLIYGGPCSGSSPFQIILIQFTGGHEPGPPFLFNSNLWGAT